MRAQLLVTLILLAVLSNSGLVASDAPASYHRCIHGHSHAFQTITKTAARLNVEYIQSDTSRADVTKPFSLPDAADSFLPVKPLRSVSALSAELPTGASGHDGPAAASQPRRYESYPPFRIHFDVSHLFSARHFCTSVGSQRSNKLGGNVTCGQDDLFSSWKRDFLLHRLIPRLGSSVEEWLSLKDVRAEERKESAGTPRYSAENRTSRVIVPQGICGSAVVIPESHSIKGVYNTDFVVYVLAAPLQDTVTTASARGSASSSSRTIAWASYCALDRRTERPLVAVMNFVPSSLVMRETLSVSAEAASASFWQRAVKRPLSFFSPVRAAHAGATERQLRKAVYDANEAMISYYSQWTAQHHRSLLHELLHALGFSPSQLQRYALRVATGRDSAATATNASMFIVSPKVIAAVRSWMNCSHAKRLPGAALEQSGLQGTVGAHWERLQFHDDLMAGVVSPNAALSGMTIAFFDSLPYYHANRLFAEHSIWGYRAGCSFAEGLCKPLRRFAAFREANANRSLSGFSQPTDGASLTRAKYWCEATTSSSAGHTQCTADRRAIGFCFAERGSLSRGNSKGGQWRSSSMTSAESRGLSLLMEGCPIVEPYSNRVCDSSTDFEFAFGDTPGTDSTGDNAHHQRRVLVEDQGYYFGPYSRCFASSDIRRLDRFAQRSLGKLMPQTLNATAGDGAPLSLPLSSLYQTPVPHTLVTTRCFRTRCVNDGTAVEVRVGTEWIACPVDGSPGVVAVSPASGYAGWVGCEAAALYCADATQLQQPARLVSTPPLAIGKANSVVLPFYRVTVTCSISLNAVESLHPLARVADAAGAFRMALVDSDRAFQAALQKDLARHRAKRSLAPLGAAMEQRAVGATRLTSATFAMLADVEGDPGRRDQSNGGSFPLQWEALVSADLEVVARDSDEALTITRSWIATTSPTANASRPIADDALLSEVALMSTAEWLSRASCAALAFRRCENANSSCLLGIDERGTPSTSPSVLVAETTAVGLAASEQAACPVGNPTRPFPVTWNASARNHAASLSVVGPLDVSEQNGGAADFLEVAFIRLRLRFNSADATSVFSFASTAKVGRVVAHTAEEWVSRPTTLLALTKDLSSLLGLSSQMVRVAFISHSAKTPELTKEKAKTPHSETAFDASHFFSQNTIDVGLGVSLPVLGEVPAWGRTGSGVSAAGTGSSTSLTWAAFTERVRAAWQLLLTELVDRATAEGSSLCLLRHASALLTEQQRYWVADEADGANLTFRVKCPVALNAVVGVRAPRAGASAEDLLGGSGKAKAKPWWGRRVTKMGGFTVTVAAVLGSVLVAALLLLCGYRYGR
ncbi:putative major surface protease GP63 [Leptomonas seymouri]|uniref:leishmanolysin n=1 Tax=Leptomonas seymouri TaxID=5684 RepID=A0A0N1IMN4_LEPSE|nr:putative major surface protease GP63 [Leptomonas seymouri]|eukprot:KPI90271.1 putative major surface protease GP63 [Leptomonas seymouri]